MSGSFGDLLLLLLVAGSFSLRSDEGGCCSATLVPKAPVGGSDGPSPVSSLLVSLSGVIRANTDSLCLNAALGMPKPLFRRISAGTGDIDGAPFGAFAIMCALTSAHAAAAAASGGNEGCAGWGRGRTGGQRGNDET